MSRDLFPLVHVQSSQYYKLYCEDGGLAHLEDTESKALIFISAPRIEQVLLVHVQRVFGGAQQRVQDPMVKVEEKLPAFILQGRVRLVSFLASAKIHHLLQEESIYTKFTKGRKTCVTLEYIIDSSRSARLDGLLSDSHSGLVSCGLVTQLYSQRSFSFSFGDCVFTAL